MGVTATEQNLLTELIALEQAVTSLPAAIPKPNLLAYFARIDELTRQLPEDADPALLHYLQKKSYQKARLWLEGRDAQNQAGTCGH